MWTKALSAKLWRDDGFEHLNVNYGSEHLNVDDDSERLTVNNWL